MAGSVLGKYFTISTWGESHGKGIGVVVDGCPAGIALCEDDIQVLLDRRKPGQNKYTTARKESDKVEILSGIYEGKTTGTPISLMVWNQDQHSKDYSKLAKLYRPGHADYTFEQKYDIRDPRGGGRTSGRETIGRVAAGAIAIRILNELGITFTTYVKQIGPFAISDDQIKVEDIGQNPLNMANNEVAEKAAQYLDQLRAEKDSSGGLVECRINQLPVGLGEAVFDKLDANLAKAMLSIGAVKGFEVGDGFGVVSAKGSDNNDNFVIRDGSVTTVTNHAGGTLGGLSSGQELIFRVAIKPTPSIAQTQRTVNYDNEEIDLEIEGRHDPIIAPRAVVVVEAMAALVILDLLMDNMTSKIDYIKTVYQTKIK